MKKPIVIRDLLNRLNKTINAVAARELGKFGLTLPQLLVIRQLAHEPKTIGQISKAMDLSYSTVSGIIDRLEREELLERERDVEDRRVVWIRTTPKLKEFKSRVPLFSEEFFNEMFRDFSESELDSIINTLDTLIQKIEKAEEKS
jgi:DNA-binding MarR family transcriptional regulator